MHIKVINEILFERSVLQFILEQRIRNQNSFLGWFNNEDYSSHECNLVSVCHFTLGFKEGKNEFCGASEKKLPYNYNNGTLCLL